MQNRNSKLGTRNSIKNMGKKRIVKTGGESGATAPTVSSVSKKKVDVGMLFVQSTYNNTKIILTDVKGNVLATSSSGAIGFKGAKKGTPFAATKVGEIIGGKASVMGMKDAYRFRG